MRLRDLLNILDPLSNIAIWFSEDDDEDGPTYEGSAMDCPYWLSELYIYNGLEDGECALSVRGNGQGGGVLVISITNDTTKC